MPHKNQFQIYRTFFNHTQKGSGKIPHATGQLNPCATTVEPVF